MKYKILTVVLVLGMIAAAVGFQNIELEKNRYHQHKMAVEKDECTDHDDRTFCTHLPLIHIVTDEEMPNSFQMDANGNKVPNETFVGATVEYFDNEIKNNHLTDTATVKERAIVRTRGASSREFDKKGYLIKFKEEDLVLNKRVSLSGMTKDSEWALHGPFMDKTLIRNYMCYNLSGEIMEYAPNVRFCEAFLNGEYIGVYLLTEKVEYNADGRINIERSDADMDETAYIVEVDREEKDYFGAINTFAEYSYIHKISEGSAGYTKIVYPGNGLTEEQKQFIVDDISRFEKVLYSFDYNDEDYGYENFIDVDSFVDYFLINEFTLNYDAMTLSRYIYKDIGSKIKLCVWDFNSAFDNYEHPMNLPETFLLQDSRWYEYLMKDESFVDQVVKRYWKLRESYFDEAYLLNYIDETIAYLGPAIGRNYEKWGYSFESEYNGVNYDYLEPIERNPRNYEEAVKQLKDCIRQRIVHMDTHIDRLYSLCHESLNKKYNYEKEGP